MKPEQLNHHFFPKPLKDYSKAEIAELDTALVRAELATYPVVAAAKDYVLPFAQNYSGFEHFKQDMLIGESFDFFIVKLEDLIQTVCIEHATTYDAVQDHTEGMTQKKLITFWEWINTFQLPIEDQKQLEIIITELVRLTGEYISKYKSTKPTLPTAITEENFLTKIEVTSELEEFYEELELFLSDIEYDILPESLIEMYCEHHSVSEEELLIKLQQIEQEEGISFDSLYDLFGPLLFE